MNKIRPWLLLLLVFITGVAVGVAGTRLAVRRAVGNPQFLRERIERELVVQLKLSPEQRPKVHQALLDSQNQINQLRRDFQPRFLEILENTKKEIAATLSPGQREKLDKLINEKKKRWKLAAPDRLREHPFAPRPNR